ncbi:putative ribonuclease H-like domain-containing protein, partial [Tanacetum coccineum]
MSRVPNKKTFISFTLKFSQVITSVKYGHNIINTYSVAQALNDPDWVEAMQEEMQQFVNQDVLKLVPLPEGKTAIGTKWILKNKRDDKGHFEEIQVWRMCSY